jgi:hypothetical protein
MQGKALAQLATILNEAPRSVASNSDAIISIRPGYTRLREHLILTGLVLADITAISIWKNGQIFRQLGSATQLDKINQYNGLPSFASSGVLTISHCREGLRRFVETHATGVGMATGTENAINSLEIKLTIGTVGGTPSIESYGEVTAPTQAGIILGESIRTMTYAANGEIVIDDLITQPEQLDAIFLEETGLVVDRLEVFNNERSIFNRPKVLNDCIINQGGFKLPQANLFAYDKSERGFGKEPLLVTPNSRFRLVMNISGITGTGTLKVRKVSFMDLSPAA